MNFSELVDYLIEKGSLSTPRIKKAFKTIDRKDFVREEHKSDPYGDYPLPIGFGQTISQPTTVAMMLEMLQPQEGDRVLDIGTGSGWTTAILAIMVGPEGYVVGVEKVSELVDFGAKNLKKYDFDNVRIFPAEETLGKPELGPFDKVLVSASAHEFPVELLEQVKVGGIVVIPVKNSVFRVKKTSENDYVSEEYPGFAFVPLVK